MDDEYIARKIHMCIELVNTATSEAQKEIYQGYLKFWQEKHKNIIISTSVDEDQEPEVEDKIPPPEIADNGKIICDICGNEFAKAGYPNHRTACEKKQLEAEVEEIISESVEVEEDSYLKDLEAQKAALQKELENLEKIAEKKILNQNNEVE